MPSGAGYAGLYIQQKWYKKYLENEAKFSVYRVLYEIDYQLGTKPEIQLWFCCAYAVDLDIIMVRNISYNSMFFIF